MRQGAAYAANEAWAGHTAYTAHAAYAAHITYAAHSICYYSTYAYLMGSMRAHLIGESSSCMLLKE